MNLGSHGLGAGKIVRNVWTGPIPPKYCEKIGNIGSDHFENFAAPDGAMFGGAYPMAGICTSRGMYIQARHNNNTNMSGGTSPASAANAFSTSPDGHTWTARAAPAASLWSSFVEIDQKVYAFSTNRIVVTENDGVTWTQHSTGTYTACYKPILFKNTLLICRPGSGGPGLNIHNLQNNTQTAVANPTGTTATYAVTGIATDGNKLVVAVRADNQTSYICVTEDLQNWTQAIVKTNTGLISSAPIFNVTNIRPLEVTFDGEFFIVALMLHTFTGGSNPSLTSKIGFARSKTGSIFDLCGIAESQDNYYKAQGLAQMGSSFPPSFVTFDTTFETAYRNSNMESINGRTAYSVTLTYVQVIDASYTRYTLPCLVYSNDHGETWLHSEPLSTASTAVIGMADLHTCPNGFVGYLCSQGAAALSKSYITNGDAKQVFRP